ncbi:hypothetical protein BO70DRAFT_83445 [Aspergillus heteromorphus CBS 117.55]|uniref:Uncharacterized protein n=1 Tax=Aspergillus heteromorphus CBS 117.55 TaxID=1448321 RepID=A0A317X3A3_9EURO|nr:uncharacterized protein BO70DRAFT_83445 [Aspergillus heteromorphus CBS 117.55]PWY91040.1 hypothetical protein BO70DRAFT_83445 [Aspergillus heteromorphus CBS 117.55]
MSNSVFRWPSDRQCRSVSSEDRGHPNVFVMLGPLIQIALPCNNLLGLTVRCFTRKQYILSLYYHGSITHEDWRCRVRPTFGPMPSGDTPVEPQEYKRGRAVAHHPGFRGWCDLSLTRQLEGLDSLLWLDDVNDIPVLIQTVCILVRHRPDVGSGRHHRPPPVMALRQSAWSSLMVAAGHLSGLAVKWGSYINVL